LAGNGLGGGGMNDEEDDDDDDDEQLFEGINFYSIFQPDGLPV
jgi:hypothetical protein